METDVTPPLLALCSIAPRFTPPHMRERRTKKERTQAREKRMSQGVTSSDVINLMCPSCSKNAPHNDNRKRGAQGFEVMVNCGGSTNSTRVQLPPYCNRGQLLITMARFPRPSIRYRDPRAQCSLPSSQPPCPPPARPREDRGDGS